jgi:hypothetical protein
MVGKKRPVVLLCVLAAASAALALATLVVTNKPAGAATDKLPDLGMAKISDVQIQTQNNKRLLRFTTRIVNIGAGAFELHGSRSSTADPTMTVTQRIFNDAGGYRDATTSAEMYYSGDGHAHWHARNLAQYTLTRPSDPLFERTGSKQGFCFYDNVKWFVTDASGKPPAGVPARAVYTGCANNQPAALNVKAGLSRGWGDRYGAKLVGQYIDITGVPDGSYTLTTTADEGNWFEEVSETNNSTSADLRIQGNQVSVTAYGPSAPKVR